MHVTPRNALRPRRIAVAVAFAMIAAGSLAGCTQLHSQIDQFLPPHTHGMGGAQTVTPSPAEL